MPDTDPLYELFNQAFHKYYDPLCRYAATLVKDPQSCEDIVQELFLKIWEKKKDLIGKEDLGFYLFASVRNNCLTWITRQGKMQITGDEFPEPVPEPERAEASGKDFNQLLEEAMENLPPKCREIFVMSRVSTLTYKQIAEVSGISEKTVENQMGKSLRILRAFIKGKMLFFLL